MSLLVARVPRRVVVALPALVVATCGVMACGDGQQAALPPTGAAALGGSAGDSASEPGGSSAVGGSGASSPPGAGAGGSLVAAGNGGAPSPPVAGSGGTGGTTPALAIVAPDTPVLDGQQLALAKQQLRAGDAETNAALGKLLVLADAALPAGPWSVMDKSQLPPSGDKHDYMSLSRYWWPTGNGADGCPYERRDGQTNPDTATNNWDHTRRLEAMEALYALSAAWYFTDDARYGERAALVAKTWFLDPETRMNPNIDFGESIPCSVDGRSTGVLNWMEVMGEALDAVAMLDTGAPGWTPADQAAMRAWLGDFATWLTTSELGVEEGERSNNHATWYDTGVAAIFVYLDEDDRARQFVERAKGKIDRQIENDGAQPEELARTNTWTYSNYNLEGFCKMAFTAGHVGENLWGYTAAGGGSIPKAIAYLIDGAVGGLAAWGHEQLSPMEPSWAVSLLHAAADFAGDARAADALTKVPEPAQGDFWPLLRVCTAAARQAPE